MKNCSAGDYGYLSKQEWQLCLGGQKPPPFAVGLGQEAPSVWQQQRDAARKAEAPFEQPCPQGTLDSNLGLPCQHFSGSLLGISPQPRQ